MPVYVEKRKDKYRLVEPSGSIAKNKSGTAIDGGGHVSKAAAQKQATAVNINLHKKKK